MNLGIRNIPPPTQPIPMAISTLRTATSPRLPGIQLTFAGPSAGTRSVGTSIEVVGAAAIFDGLRTKSLGLNVNSEEW